jgi:hypothetical protein
MTRTRTEIAFFSVLLSLAFGATAWASCPEIEGKYDYHCTVEKDSDARFGKVLDVDGSMIVQQKGCDAYVFLNPATQVAAEFVLNDPNGQIRGKVRRSNSDLIKFKTIERVSGIKHWVEKGKIRKKKNGFTLDGKEKSRVLGIFGSRHSKFSCSFKIQD